MTNLPLRAINFNKENLRAWASEGSGDGDRAVRVCACRVSTA